jgi:hypothetical protein
MGGTLERLMPLSNLSVCLTIKFTLNAGQNLSKSAILPFGFTMSFNHAFNSSWFVEFIYFVINCFWCNGWELGKRRFWMFWDGFFLWVLHEVGLHIDESKNKIDMVISGQEMGGNASLSTVINSTKVSGPTRVSRIYLLRNKLFLVHRLGIRQTEILDVLGQIFSLGVA